MKKLIGLVLLCALLVGCGSAAKGTEKATRTVYAMDTVMTLTAYAPENGPSAAQAALEEAEAELHRLDALLSIAQESSEIYCLNRDGAAPLSQETAALLDRARILAEYTEGAFDPTVYPLMELWGFPQQEYRVPAQREIDDLLGTVGAQQVEIAYEDGQSATLPEGGGIDLGGIAKGYAGEQVLETIQAAGVSSAIISLGGNVGTLGRKPDGSLWTVAIEDPEQSGGYLGELTLDGGYFAITSGGYQRYFEEAGKTYHHILDPETGYPAETDLKSVTIISQDGTAADAYSTALFVMGREKAVRFWRNNRDFDMVLYDGSTLYVTPGVQIETTLPLEEIA